MILDHKEQKLLQIVFGKICFEESMIGSPNMNQLRNDINREKIRAAVHEIIKEYPATTEEQWVDFFKKIKKEQGYER